MEPEPEAVDLSVLAPERAHFERAVASITARALEQRRFRRAVVWRGGTALVIAAAAGLALWLSAPVRRHDTVHTHDLLDWAIRDVNPNEVLGLGGNDAQ